jgi:hypothetical protein
MTKYKIRNTTEGTPLINETKDQPMIKNGAVIIETDNGAIHQVLLTKSEGSAILSLIRQLHQGTVKISNEKLEGIIFEFQNNDN